MKVDSMKFKGILSGLMFLILMCLSISDAALSFEFADWEHGATGYELNFMIAEEEEKPLILYFHVEDSVWCKKMNENYLAVYEVEEFFSDIPKVDVNPDKGEFEKALAAKFGVEQFPAFFITIPSFKTKPQRIHPFSKDHNMTVNEFIKKIKGLIVSHYNKKAHSYFGKKEYEKALEYFEKALGYDPEVVYIYYAMGIIYHTIASDKNDPAFLKKAEENYLKALKIDPKHKESKGELEKLRKGMVKTGVK
ncbi:tetratricopeptide repeat protein [Thermodesulfobacteriota bacterium]